MTNTDIPRPARLRVAALWLLVMVPVAVVWGYKVEWYPRPYWVTFYDPEAIHYYNGGLGIARGQTPTNIHNPATPLQLLNAGIIWGGGFGATDFPRFLPRAYWL